MSPHDWVPLRWSSGPTEALKGSPFNCLVVRDASDDLIKSAISQGLAVISEQSLPPDVTAVTDAEWPSVRVGRGGNAEAGPTGYPWVDANGWRCQLAAAVHPDTAVWTMAQPKQPGTRTEIYALAVADAAAYNARWVVAPEPGMIGTEAWSTLCRSVAFFENRRKSQQALTTFARVGVLSDFAGDQNDLSEEFLNLASRRQLPVRPIVAGKETQESLEGLKALVTIGKTPLKRELLQVFVKNGGTIVLPPGPMAKEAASHAKPVSHDTGYTLYRIENGAVAVSPEEWSDPYLLAQDVHRLISRSNDVVRLYNAGSSLAYPTIGRKRAIVHLLNYSGRPAGHLMSLYIARQFDRARFTDLSGRSQALKTERKGEGTEVNLPIFTSYGAVDFGESA